MRLIPLCAMIALLFGADAAEPPVWCCDLLWADGTHIATRKPVTSVKS